MISRFISGKGMVNQFGFFSYLKERYQKEKVFHLLNNLDVKKLDDNKKLEFSKKLILLRNDIDGKDKVGIQAIKSYLNYLCIQEKQLIKSKQIQSDDHIFYKSIFDKCADVDLVRQATMMSEIFYYINGGDIKLLRLQLEFDLLFRKIYFSDLQDKFEQMYYKARLKDVLDKLVQYTNKHYNSDNELIQTLSKKYLYHLNNSQEFMKESKFQEALDELVVSQTQLNSIWQKVENKDDFRVHYQRLIIDKLVITAKSKYCLKQQEGLQIFIDAINNYVDNVGIDEQFYDIYTDVVKFLFNFDSKGCLLVLERLPQLDLNLQRLELERIKILTLQKLDQLKRQDVEKLMDLYSRLENQNEETDYAVEIQQIQYSLFFYEINQLVDNHEMAYQFLEVSLKKLLLQNLVHQSNLIIQIAKSISYFYLIQSQNALQIYDLIIQISEKSCYRLKDNFNQLQFEDQIKTLSTERIIISIQSEIDIRSVMRNQLQNDSHLKTFQRLQYIDDLFQAKKQLRLPILEILKNHCIEDKEISQKIDSLRDKILNTDI